MAKLAMTAMVVLSLPLIVLLSGGYVMTQMSNRKAVHDSLSKLDERDAKPLGRRFGCDMEDVKSYWAPFDPAAFKAERWFLELDLVFPFFYGAALATGLLMAWAAVCSQYSSAPSDPFSADLEPAD